jgi:hypothetical protein
VLSWLLGCQGAHVWDLVALDPSFTASQLVAKEGTWPDLSEPRSAFL